MTTINIVQGWTGAIDFELQSDGVAADLTDLAITLILFEPGGRQITLAGSVSVTNATGGRVQYNAAANDFREGSYRGRFKAIDGSSKVVYFPNGDPDTWVVSHP